MAAAGLAIGLAGIAAYLGLAYWPAVPFQRLYFEVGQIRAEAVAWIWFLAQTGNALAGWRLLVSGAPLAARTLWYAQTGIVGVLPLVLFGLQWTGIAVFLVLVAVLLTILLLGVLERHAPLATILLLPYLGWMVIVLRLSAQLHAEEMAGRPGPTGYSPYTKTPPRWPAQETSTNAAAANT